MKICFSFIAAEGRQRQTDVAYTETHTQTHRDVRINRERGDRQTDRERDESVTPEVTSGGIFSPIISLKSNYCIALSAASGYPER